MQGPVAQCRSFVRRRRRSCYSAQELRWFLLRPMQFARRFCAHCTCYREFSASTSNATEENVWRRDVLLMSWRKYSMRCVHQNEFWIIQRCFYMSALNMHDIREIAVIKTTGSRNTHRQTHDAYRAKVIRCRENFPIVSIQSLINISITANKWVFEIFKAMFSEILYCQDHLFRNISLDAIWPKPPKCDCLTKHKEIADKIVGAT